MTYNNFKLGNTMTLEEQYIQKLNFNLGKISKKVNVSIKKEPYSLIHFVELNYISKSFNGFITLRLYYDETKTFIEAKLNTITEIDHLVLSTFNSIVYNFKSFLKLNPLFFYYYARDKQVEYFNTLNTKSKINFNLTTLYDLIVKKSYNDNIEFLNNMLPSKSYKINFLDTSYRKTELYEYFQINSLSLRICFKKNAYFFTFFDKLPISLSFDNALILLSLFKINKNFKLFDIIGGNIELIGNKESIDSKESSEIEKINIYLEKLLLENTIKNF